MYRLRAARSVDDAVAFLQDPGRCGVLSSGAVPATELPIVSFVSREAWTVWLRAEHATSPGVWLKLAKRDSGFASVSYSEALDVALCFGWIDGQKRAHDESHWLQRFTPRGPRSRWSRINRDRAIALMERGEMQPAGLAQVEAAQADGRWEAAYEGARAATVPADLQAALDADPRAREFFATLDGANRYAILYRVQEAKRPETRARRIAKFVAMLAAGEKLHS
jgi:uncharacterized protein YdeI (YjbR/CyaY-like superfamily)